MKKLGIGYRITVGLVITALLTAGLSISLFYTLTDRAFNDYIEKIRIQQGLEVSDTIGEAYTRNGWPGVQDLILNTTTMKKDPRMLHRIQNGGRRMGQMMGIAHKNITVADLSGNIMASSVSMKPKGKLPSSLWKLRVPVFANQEHVGYVIVWTPVSQKEKSLESAFSKTISRYSYIVAFLGIAIALLAGFLTSRKLQKPIKDLSKAVRLFSKGHRDVRIPIMGDDELGTLASDFNTMAETIEKSEELRKNLTADVAHELRTPLSILRGTLESIQTGILDPTPDIILSLQDETIRMTRLIKDLSDLSQAEAGSLELTLEKISPSELKDRFIHFKTEASLKGIDFEVDIPDGLPELYVDTDRLIQVIYNLLNNALRHTAYGKIRLSAKSNPRGIEFIVADTGKGIKKEDLPFVFERFYREEKSRSRKTGGMGLGLSIAKGIVKAHGGRIWVESEEGHGSTFSFFLPDKHL